MQYQEFFAITQIADDDFYLERQRIPLPLGMGYRFHKPAWGFNPLTAPMA
jgi:hypothetical protein